MKKKNIIIVFIITLIVIGIIIGGFFLTKDKLKPTKKETETKNELKKAGSCTKSVSINNSTGYKMKFDVKDAVPSTTESGKYDYYGQMSLYYNNSYRPIDYTWKLYTRTSPTLTPSESYVGSIIVNRNSYYTNDYLIIKYYPNSEAKGKLKPTTVIFKYNSSKNLYELEKAIPFPQWQVLNYNGTNYDSESGVSLSFNTSSYGATGYSSDYIIYYTLPDDPQYDGLVEQHKITFTSSGMLLDNQNSIYSNYPIRQKGNLVISN